jgi:mono/diheme cytochrome c family protein
MPEVSKPTTADIHGRFWGTRAREWADIQEVLMRPVYETVLDRAGVTSGTVHLDVGCSAGLAAQMAASRGAQVSGIDASQQEAALRNFASAAGLEPVEIFDVETPFVYPDQATALRGLNSSGVAARAIEITGETAVAEAHANAVAPYRRPDGSFRFGAVFRCTLARVALVLALATVSQATVRQRAEAADIQVERGKYLVTIAGCSDCHTPGALMGKPDMKNYLGGSDVGFAIPGEGVFVPPNLTPDKETGLGNWTVDQVVTALTTGMRPDGRKLAPIMPYEELAYLTRDDVLAIVAFLKSLPPVTHKVPGPFGPNDKPTTFVMAVLPADVYAALPKSPK